MTEMRENPYVLLIIVNEDFREENTSKKKMIFRNMYLLFNISVYSNQVHYTVI